MLSVSVITQKFSKMYSLNVFQLPDMNILRRFFRRQNIVFYFSPEKT